MRSRSMNRPGRAASASHFTPQLIGFGVLVVLLLGAFGFLQQQAQTHDKLQKSIVMR